jgi:uncharacterized protein
VVPRPVIARLEIVAKPGSRAPGITRRGGDVLVAVRARAVDGQANVAIVRTVAAWLAIPASRVRLLHGGSGRRKLLALEDVDENDVRARIALLPGE